MKAIAVVTAMVLMMSSIHAQDTRTTSTTTTTSSSTDDNTMDSRGIIKNTLGIGPRLGYYKTSDNGDGAFFAGVQGRVRVGDVIGFEGAVDYRTDEKFSFQFGNFNASTSVHSIPVTASILFFAPIDVHLAPYILGGAGLYFLTVDYSDDLNNIGFKDESMSKFGYHLGFGLEIPVNKNIAVNADYRYLFLESSYQDNPNQSNTKLSDKTNNGSVFTAGLMIYL